MAASAAPRFRPSNATILSSQSDVFTDFLRAKLEDDLESVPGIGPASKASLQAAGIETTHHLIGQFLLLRDPDCQAHMDAFHIWLSEVGVTGGQKNNVIMAISQKVDVWIPGTWDDSLMDE
eukprot:CAMPEP_0119484004 /NCGR_PEP_ID=MMETSP1344-20130328/11153_1 /TAXON_ID=236787 /ORGANISM="Florenciella parvula, Strain CCMP2471" /LENGTH=120 /DNA_ID=CAMNT_0007518535 /DNA_START=135 /DNA_END=497 /DNA_ORIENTATION=-